MYFCHLMTGYESAPISGPLAVIQKTTTTQCSALHERMLEMFCVQSKQLNLRPLTAHFCTVSTDTLDSSGTSTQIKQIFPLLFFFLLLFSNLTLSFPFWCLYPSQHPSEILTPGLSIQEFLSLRDELRDGLSKSWESCALPLITSSL